ncbi:Trm112p-like domain-containing protein [Cryptosporidium muris RN66]|uniref:Trm112p-like domain-containing protein n=1 Tax=Cryptosporidium muris (strain RN66) TaxID=441375 RepID=B6AH67_CRYMR|nr:Trm112p-like domain-containing protein [Cryptosporidium muris RN66]EEA07558.1 Trm112p-like domain-containing protein [Cryptosporidium muris RN66]|eukprot:XP_002141907.1 Trm112p-like domain-containing protein [Cryptosporidium muris RN66]
MRLLTHNILMCNRKCCKNGFPLEIKLRGDKEEATSQLDTYFSREQIQSMLEKLDWEVLVSTAAKFDIELPISYNLEDKNDDIFLKAVHNAIMNFQILEADLICPICNHKYTVSKGVPNMLDQENIINNVDIDMNI